MARRSGNRCSTKKEALDFDTHSRMKNILQVDLDTEREHTVIIAKPGNNQRPKTADEAARIILGDMATLCEAVCTMIHVAEQHGIKSSADSVRDCIRHIEHGFGDAGYVGKLLDAAKPPNNH